MEEKSKKHLQILEPIWWFPQILKFVFFKEIKWFSNFVKTFEIFYATYPNKSLKTFETRISTGKSRY